MKPLLKTKDIFENNIKDDISFLRNSLDYYNYHVINDYIGYQILIKKRKFDILIQITNYEIFLNEKELSA